MTTYAQILPPMLIGAGILAAIVWLAVGMNAAIESHERSKRGVR